MRSRMSESRSLKSLTVYPDDYRAGQPSPVVVCLHGCGADKNDLTGLARALGPSGYLYVFPDGPRLAFDGADATMRAWYERGGQESPETVQEALTALDSFM